MQIRYEGILLKMSWINSFTDEITKIAIVGIAGDLYLLGLPSVTGYVLGKNIGENQKARGKKGPPKKLSTRDSLGLAFIPGAAGYQLGLRKGHRRA